MDTKPPVDSNIRRRWTADDEARLLDLQSRKASVMNENRARLVLAMSVDDHSFAAASAIDYMIENARVIRQALAPFDHADIK